MKSNCLAFLAIIVFAFPAHASEVPTHPREKEAINFAVAWLDLVENQEAEKSFNLMTPIFRANLSLDTWRRLLAERDQQLGAFHGRELHRIVWYEDPVNAPLPGTYAAVEFNSNYENTRRHFQYIILHSQNGEPFRVMRQESTILEKLTNSGEKGEN